MTRMRDRWDAGGKAVGSWLMLADSVVAETVGRAGFDYVCVDNQHGIIDYAATVGLLQALDLGGATTLVRVPANEPGVIGKMLDAGADGIIIPMVNSVAEAEAAVRACRYAPAGARSYGPTRAALRTDDYHAGANDRMLCIPMIETVAALEALDDILAVPGIDAIYVGPADLSITLGLPPGNNDGTPSFDDALAAILAGCARAGVRAGIHSTPALAASRLDAGFDFVTVTADLGALRSGLTQALATLDRDRSSTDTTGY